MQLQNLCAKHCRKTNGIAVLSHLFIYLIFFLRCGRLGKQVWTTNCFVKVVVAFCKVQGSKVCCDHPLQGRSFCGINACMRIASIGTLVHTNDVPATPTLLNSNTSSQEALDGQGANGQKEDSAYPFIYTALI